tara:strand:- start:1813 stop:2490 length:678 start_codon:yes stop_codon:yes gene_type:complete
MGLVGGIAIVSVIALAVMLTDNQPGTTSDSVAGTNTAPTPSPTPPSPPSTGDSSKVAEVTDADHIRGNVDASVTLIEYSDFQCPFCQRHIPTLEQVLEQYEGDVRLVYRHFPLNSIHPQAQKAAEASECAGEQGQFWEYHDTLFENQTALQITNLKSYAGNLGLNQSQFDSCLDSDKYASKVNGQAAEAQAAGITGTPGTFVNSELVKGAYPLATFTTIIDGLLN